MEMEYKPTWFTRLLDEKTELQNKLDKLGFLVMTANLEAEIETLLWQQLDVMSVYMDILKKRIDLELTRVLQISGMEWTKEPYDYTEYSTRTIASDGKVYEKYELRRITCDNCGNPTMEVKSRDIAQCSVCAYEKN